MKTLPCPNCAGSGRVLDDRAIGLELRKKREQRGLSLHDLAARLKISASYLSDMELGHRRFHSKFIRAYKQLTKTR